MNPLPPLKTIFKRLRYEYRLHRIQRVKGRIDTDSLDWQTLRQARLAMDGYKCQHSGVEARNIGELYSIGFQVHHIVPVSQGGSNKLSNLETVTKAAHAKLHPWL